MLFKRSKKFKKLYVEIISAQIFLKTWSLWDIARYYGYTKQNFFFVSSIVFDNVYIYQMRKNDYFLSK